MQNAGFLFSAYIIAWALVFGYVLFLLNKQKNIRSELESLKENRDNKK